MRQKDYPPRPRLSRSQVNKYGDDLRDYGLRHQEVVQVVNAWREAHLYPMDNLRQRLLGITREYDGYVIVAQRLKRISTIIDKLRRFSGMELGRMGDVAGVRVVLSDLSQVRKLEKYFFDSKETYNIVKVHDYISSPKQDGYRGVHIIFAFKGADQSERQYDGLFTELQIRTEYEHAWSTAVEIAGTVRGEKFKNGEGDRHWREFFRLVSEAIEMIEFIQADKVDEYARKTHMVPKELFTKIKALDIKYHIVSDLTAYTFAIKRIAPKNAGYYILVLDPERHRLEVLGFSQAKYDEALTKYAELESQNAGTSIDQVLVSAGNIRRLQQAFPNYFLDIGKLHGFIAAVEELAEE